MKRLLTLAAMFLCCVATTFAQFSGSGTGTEEDPYLIFNQDQLAQVSNFLDQEGVVFKLMKDLDLTNWIAENNPNQGWLPIGVESSPFKGVFYGNNHKVTGLMIKRNSTNHVGFFGSVSGATINNFTIEGSSVLGNDCVGVLVGSVIGSTITNCHIMMTESDGVKGKSSVGGFAGYSNNTTYNTFSASVSVTSSEKTGGLIGYVDSGTFTEGTVSGTIVGAGDYTGGLIGWAKAATLTNINIKRTISGQDYTGGITGYCENGILNNCTYEGDLTGKQYVGGVAGSLETSTTSFADCFTKGRITASGDYIGGIVGISKGACIESLESCSHFGDINGLSYVGGLIGAVLNTVAPPTLHTYESRKDYYDSHVNWYYETISTGTTVTKMLNNCTAIGNINGNTCVGGLVGYETTSNGYTPSSNIINDTYERTDPNYRPKQGQPQIRYITVGCAIYDGTEQVGRAPYTYYTYTRNTISLSLTNNYYSGNIQGTDNVGGLVGYKSGGTLQNNFSHATIYGSLNVGGIVGQVSGEKESESYDTTTIKSNVSINSIVSATSSNVGRIYGLVETDYVIIGTLASSEANRALTQTRVVLQGVVQEVDDDFQNGTSIGPSALKLKANYVSWGWNFDENWNILETESYPYKKYQAAPPVIESELVSQKMGISGKSLNGGTVYLYYKDQDAVSTTCNGNNWTFSTEPLQSGAQVKVYADVEGMTPSYFATSFVGYPGSGTEEDPYRIYTAEDLQGASNRGYYKLMNDINLSSWINENSPMEGWPAIGRNSGEVTYIDGDNHKVTGLWINTTENFNGLFSNFSAGQIKNLTVEVASGKKVKGGDYTGILIGRNAKGSIVNCKVKGDVEGTNHTGGVAGLLLTSGISEITFDGTITSGADNAFVGGLAGQTEECNVSACNIKSVINLTGAEGKAGGLIGESKNGTIKSSNAQITLTATGANYYAGGLVGYSETPITLCSSGGTVTASGDNSYSGGLVGYALSPIDNCYSTAKTTGIQFTAGLVGYTFSSIDKCYASGDVYGYMYGAGVVGELDGPNASLTNSVACNNILSLSAQSSWGCRVIGGFKNGASDPNESNLALSTMQVSLNGVPQNKTDDIVEGKATSLELLKTKVTYEVLGWDFSKIWKIEEGISYPYLIASGGTGGSDPVNPDDPNPQTTVEVTDVSNMANAIYVEPLKGSAGTDVNIKIKLKNANSVTSYGFELVLPAGVTISTSTDGDFDDAVTMSARHKEHTLTTNKLTNNTYKVAVISLSSKALTDNDGVVLTIKAHVDDNIIEGEYAIGVQSPLIVNTDGTKPAIQSTQSKITIEDYIKGDVDGDGVIDLADAVLIINYYVGKPVSKFVEKAADVDGDGEVDVADAVRIVNLVVGKIPALAPKFGFALPEPE